MQVLWTLMNLAGLAVGLVLLLAIFTSMAVAIGALVLAAVAELREVRG